MQMIFYNVNESVARNKLCKQLEQEVAPYTQYTPDERNAVVGLLMLHSSPIVPTSINIDVKGSNATPIDLSCSRKIIVPHATGKVAAFTEKQRNQVYNNRMDTSVMSSMLSSCRTMLKDISNRQSNTEHDDTTEE